MDLDPTARMTLFEPVWGRPGTVGCPFSSVDDMARISGIGPARIADIKAQGLACV